MRKVVLFLSCVLTVLVLLSLARADDAAFDLAGPKIDVRVERGDKGLPIGQVPNLLPGDRLYFYKPGQREIGHAAIYMGNGQFIHASSNRGKVAVDNLGDETYWDIYAGARRS